jgi:hypothetical protein
MWRIVSIALFGAQALFGCRSEKAGTQDLLGKWTISLDSRRRLPELPQQALMTVELKADQTFLASELPGDLFVVTGRSATLVSGSGVWKLNVKDGEQYILLEFRTVNTGGPEIRVPFGAELYFTKRRHDVSLYYFRGDPDQNVRIVFHRHS